MSRFLPYSPDQVFLLPPNVKDVLGEDHLCFFVHEVVEHLDLTSFEDAYKAEGGALYAPELMLKVWLYAYAVGLTSARQLERRIREELGLRYLAGGAQPDNWALSAFRRLHARGINDAFTQVVEMARKLGLARLGKVAIDSTRVKASASKDKVESKEKLREQRAKDRKQIRKWQKDCNQAEGDEKTKLEAKIKDLEEKLEKMPERLERLAKSGEEKLSPVDEDARFVKARGGFILGYTGEIAVSEDHIIVSQQVTQAKTDNARLVPILEEVKKQCGEQPAVVLADTGYFSLDNLNEMERRGIEAYIPDSNMAQEINKGKRCPKMKLQPVQKRMRTKLRSKEGRTIYGKRKGIVEPVFGVLKEQRGMRSFRLRGLEKVGNEFGLAAIAFNLTRLFNMGATL
jgi:transposase/IS5 family transposase